MATKYFKDLKETIEKARKNDAPRKARLVLLGRVLQSGLCFELTPEEQEALEELAGRQEDFSDEEWFRVMEFALFGHDDEYTREGRPGASRYSTVMMGRLHDVGKQNAGRATYHSAHGTTAAPHPPPYRLFASFHARRLLAAHRPRSRALPP